MDWQAIPGGVRKKLAQRYDDWLTIASHYRIAEPLHEVMSKMSHREMLVRRAWIEKQWNRPDRTDHYLMRIAALLSTGGKAGEPIKFIEVKPESPSQKQANDDLSIGMWKAASFQWVDAPQEDSEELPDGW